MEVTYQYALTTTAMRIDCFQIDSIFKCESVNKCLQYPASPGKEFNVWSSYNMTLLVMVVTSRNE